MSNRAQRRSDTRAFRREVHRDHILTYLVDVNADLDTYPLLSRAVSYWRGNIQQRRPFCPACRANFADDAEVAMFLLATPTIAPTSASVSAFCTKCWHDHFWTVTHEAGPARRADACRADRLSRQAHKTHTVADPGSRSSAG